jgi:hypothetical protein
MMVESYLRVVASLVIFGVGLMFQSATPETSANVLGCTIWRTGSVAGVELDPNCTLSPPWWDSYSSCRITPIHADVWTATSDADAGLALIPWVAPEATGAKIVGHQFYGNRPLHTDATFPDGSMAKVLWQFDPAVLGLTLIAHDLGDRSKAPVEIHDVGAANTTSGLSTDWPSYVRIPTPGCWRVDLDATTATGQAVHASVTYIVVD